MGLNEGSPVFKTRLNFNFPSFIRFQICLLKERVHGNLKTYNNIESYPFTLLIGFICFKKCFMLSYSISGQNLVHIQLSILIQPEICNDTPRVSTGLYSLKTCYRTLNVSIQTPGCAPYFGWNGCC